VCRHPWWNHGVRHPGDPVRLPAGLGTSRQWDRTYLGKGQYQNSIYRLQNVASQLCLTNVGEAPKQTACAGLTSQEWAYDGAGRYHSRTGGCLAVPGGSQTSGVKLILWPCGNGSEQKWYNGAIN
jgi:hypothetical protein